MADKLSPSRRSANMRAIKAKNTTCETSLRKALWQQGVRGYRIHYNRLPGKPDVVFTKHKLAVFVDGCFWHGCMECCRIPETNRSYWEPKLRRNVARAEAVNAALKEAGWTVLRFWEHDVKRDVSRCVEQVRAVLASLTFTRKAVEVAATSHMPPG